MLKITIKKDSFSTGDILFEKDTETAYPVASISKLMTIFIVLDHIENGSIATVRILHQILPLDNCQAVFDHRIYITLPPVILGKMTTII